MADNAFCTKTTTRILGHGSVGRRPPGGDENPSDETKETDTIATPNSQSKESPQKVDPQALQKLLKEYKDLFPNSIPGLPPDRRIHVLIPLSEGAEPVRRPMF